MMANGVEKLRVIVAVTYNDQVIILDVPVSIVDMVDNGCFLDDNFCFTNTDVIPKKVGVYELICEHLWDDGCSLGERTDGDTVINIVKVNDLYVPEIDCNIAI